MQKKRFSALTMLEACMIMLLSVLIYIYSQQHDANALEKESYKTLAVSVYSQLNKAMPGSSDSFAGKFYSEDDIVNYLAKKLNSAKICSNAKDDFCWSDTWMWNDIQKPGTQLKTIQYVLTDFISSDCSYSKNIPNTCAFIYVDSNGPNKPNEVGKDILLFYMTRQGFIPAGTESDSVTKREDCDLKNEKYNWGCTAELLGVR